MKLNLNKVTPIAILSHPRSGSNLLCEVLIQHPEITCHREIFNPSEIWYCNDVANVDWTMDQRDADRMGFLEKILDRVTTPYYVFKLFHYQSPQVWRYWLERGLPVIVHHRGNLLRSYLSWERAMQSQEWIYFGDERPPSPKIRFHSPQFLYYKARFFDPVSSLAKREKEKHRIFHSQYEAMPTQEYWKSLFEFFQISEIPYQIKMRKQCWDSLEQGVSNFGEMADFFSRNGLEELLRVPDPGEIRASSQLV